ncbi:MAG: alpha/beta fold hydrolase [Bacteroidetes bacterium]|nr:alpha/beta fold hydrolase [Bacteroidota bacterium]MBU1680597.1 alpha/beta fold hydrolase [Bacteroidota bacterium]MBU2507634.1 alpha/beta fold hydrolase [Bacteroidota bacterium]
MKRFHLLLAILFFTFSITFAQNVQLFADLGDFELESGQKIINCNIGYRLFGAFNHDSSNIILYPTWFGGTSEHLSKLISKGNLIDDSKYFVIAVDALGNGVSSSPSNSIKQPGRDFPEFTVLDMVNAQYELLTNHLGVKKLYAIIGGSMGSMQAFEWLVAYPDFMQKAIPYVCTPQRSTYDLLSMHTQLEIIETYKILGADDLLIHKTINMFRALLARTPDYIVNNVKRDEFENYLNSFNLDSLPFFTIDNFRSQLKAMIAYDIFSEYDGSMEKTAERIKADVMIIVASTDHIVHPKISIEFAKHINAELHILDSDCGHLAVGCEMRKSIELVNNFLDDK